MVFVAIVNKSSLKDQNQQLINPNNVDFPTLSVALSLFSLLAVCILKNKR